MQNSKNLFQLVSSLAVVEDAKVQIWTVVPVGGKKSQDVLWRIPLNASKYMVMLAGSYIMQFTYPFLFILSTSMDSEYVTLLTVPLTSHHIQAGPGICYQGYKMPIHLPHSTTIKNACSSTSTMLHVTGNFTFVYNLYLNQYTTYISRMNTAIIKQFLT